ncbi:MAG: acetyl-CoA acetyltransferase [Thaumarchaeota archaeon]|nr:acetyl-CoA acetyltransferase [Nitrososphaerota archaeon]
MPGKDVAIVGIGASKFDSTTVGQSYKELTFEAAKNAYYDAGIDVRNDVGSFICCAEDFWEGTSITDEYAPDQLGAKLRPLFTVSGDGLLGLAHAYMHIMSGVSDIVVVEAHSKLSDVESKDIVEDLGYDPSFARFSGAGPNYLAGLEMRRYLEESGNTVEDCAAVVVKNKKNAMKNSRAVYGGLVSNKEVLTSDEISSPLKKMDSSQSSDGSVVIVLASETKARKLADRPVWVSGISWFSDTPNVEEMDLGQAVYAVNASKRAYSMARITKPAEQLDFVEVDDTYSFKELEHLEALGLTKRAGKFVSSGKADPDGVLPVNASGGSLGMGRFIEATGLVRAYESVLQIRGEAGPLQLARTSKCAVQSWRGLPTQSGVVAVLGR